MQRGSVNCAVRHHMCVYHNHKECWIPKIDSMHPFMGLRLLRGPAINVQHYIDLIMKTKFTKLHSYFLNFFLKSEINEST